MHIEFESDEQIKNWLAEFFKEENDDKDVLPNIPYGYYELVREILRRDRIEGAWEDFDS